MAKGYSTDDYNYHLPEERIAKYPLENRSKSKLLVYQKGEIISGTFENLSDYLPENSFLLFNDTRVIEARLHFYKPTGARIEIFLLSPSKPSKELATAMEVRHSCQWVCTIGNKKKWKDGLKLELPYKDGSKGHKLKAQIVTENDVEFTWDSGHSFAEILHFIGKIPIPPYLDREKEDVDDERYQTVYSSHKGAVAAPTAGLHFTDEIITGLKERNILTGFATLHVSAGTFKPVNVEDYREHDMHTEQIVIQMDTLSRLLIQRQVYCVGTTSLRILESLYWMGVKLILGMDDPFFISKEIPYSFDLSKLPDSTTAIHSLIDFAKSNQLNTIQGQTQIFIYPGYEFKMCSGLITNFHLPKSTLLLLISAFIGGKWKDLYNFALVNNYRFLSYGDASLLIP